MTFIWLVVTGFVLDFVGLRGNCSLLVVRVAGLVCGLLFSVLLMIVVTV